MKRSYNITRRRFLELFSTSCCGLLASCSTVPITERRQLAIYPESFINKQAAGAYINFKKKAIRTASFTGVVSFAGLAWYFQSKADQHFDNYLHSGDPNTMNSQWNRTEEYDNNLLNHYHIRP